MLYPEQSTTSIFGGLTKLFKAKEDNEIYLSESKLIKKHAWLSWVIMMAEGQCCEVDVVDEMVKEMKSNPCISASTAFNKAYALVCIIIFQLYFSKLLILYNKLSLELFCF